MTKHEREIKNLLYDLRITPELKGYHYLVEAIAAKEESNTTQAFKIYRDIAEKFNATPSSVERAIRFAIKRIPKNKPPLFFTIFEPALSVHKKNITNFCFIAMAAEYIASQKAED